MAIIHCMGQFYLKKSVTMFPQVFCKNIIVNLNMWHYQLNTGVTKKSITSWLLTYSQHCTCAAGSGNFQDTKTVRTRDEKDRNNSKHNIQI